MDDLINLAPIKIEQNNNEYFVNISIKGNKMIFSINDQKKCSTIYIKVMSFNEIKELSKAFYTLDSISDFYIYLKFLSDKNKISIRKSEEKIIISLFIEVLLKQEVIEINLFPKKRDLDFNYQSLKAFQNIGKELLSIKEKMKDIEILKNENKELKENQNKEINNLKNENRTLFEIITKHNKEINFLKEEIDQFKNKSVIMKDTEKNMIFSEIENKMNKKIQKIQKLYQATINGGDPINFHSKCDNIENTLVLIKSEGNRRFGGFTPIPWTSYRGYQEDSSLKSFVFSLDMNKIFSLKEGCYSVYHNKDNGPCFGFGNDIGIEGNPLKENTLYTCKSNNFDYEGIYSLSEYDGKCGKIKALEYEVYQIIFR